MAIGALGQTSFIESLDDAGNPTAEICNLHYDRARRNALQFFPFEFAVKRVALDESSEEPPAAWAYAYAWPTDCLRPLNIDTELQIDNIEQLVPFRVENAGSARVIYTDMDSAVLRYVFDCTDTLIWTEAFIDYLAIVMAARIAMPLTSNMDLSQKMEQLARLRGYAAVASSASNIQTGELPDAGVIRARE